MLTRAMHPGKDELTDEDVAIARVIGDVWLSALVAWVTGRTTAEESAAQMDARSACSCATDAARIRDRRLARVPPSDGRRVGCDRLEQPSPPQPPKAWVAVTPPSIAISAPLM